MTVATSVNQSWFTFCAVLYYTIFYVKSASVGNLSYSTIFTECSVSETTLRFEKSCKNCTSIEETSCNNSTSFILNDQVSTVWEPKFSECGIPDMNRTMYSCFYHISKGQEFTIRDTKCYRIADGNEIGAVSSISVECAVVDGDRGLFLSHDRDSILRIIEQKNSVYCFNFPFSFDKNNFTF